MNLQRVLMPAILLLSGLASPAGIVVGQPLPYVEVLDKGLLTPSTRVQDGRMVLAGKGLGYGPWRSTDGAGRVRTIYHLAARSGIDTVNQAFCQALDDAKLPELLPDGAYKTITILNLEDALWGTRGLALGSLEASQRDCPFALFVADGKGAARAAWGLQPRQSAVIVVDRDGTVLFFKEGRLSPAEIRQAIRIIQAKLH